MEKRVKSRGENGLCKTGVVQREAKLGKLCFLKIPGFVAFKDAVGHHGIISGQLFRLAGLELFRSEEHRTIGQKLEESHDLQSAQSPRFGGERLIAGGSGVTQDLVDEAKIGVLQDFEADL